MKLAISDTLHLPANAQTATLVVYGGKGMGKTNLASVIVEELTRANLRWSWLDPLGVSWGLRHDASGRGRGVECLILGGPHGDIPIEPDGGAAVADVVVDELVNVLVDFSRKVSGEMWSKGERVRFVTAYAERLFQRQGELAGGRRREPLFQVLDEAARYIPQVIPSGAQDLAKCVGAWEQIVEEGRNIGLGVGLVTQRSARMNKSVSELADAMFAFRTVGPNSLEAVLDWLGTHVEKERIKGLAEKVRALDVGECLVVSPGWLKYEGVVRVKERTTFDSSATPKPGERPRVARGEGAKPDLDKIRARMRETIERTKADDPKELRKKIVLLERELFEIRKGRKGTIHATLKLDTRPFERAMKKAEPAIRMLEKLEHRFRSDEASAHALLEKVKGVASGLHQTLQGLEVSVETSAKAARGAGAVPSVVAPVEREPMRARPVERRAAPAPDVPAGDGKLTGPERKILTVLAQSGRRVPVLKLALLSGYSRKGTAFKNPLSSLRSKGYAEGRGDAQITQAGMDALGSWQTLPVGRELLNWWMSDPRLGTPERKILKVVADVAPNEIPVAVVAEETNYSAKGTAFKNPLSRLRSLGLVVGRGSVRLSEDLQ